MSGIATSRRRSRPSRIPRLPLLRRVPTERCSDRPIDEPQSTKEYARDARQAPVRRDQWLTFLQRRFMRPGHDPVGRIVQSAPTAGSARAVRSNGARPQPLGSGFRDVATGCDKLCCALFGYPSARLESAQNRHPPRTELWRPGGTLTGASRPAFAPVRAGRRAVKAPRPARHGTEPKPQLKLAPARAQADSGVTAAVVSLVTPGAGLDQMARTSNEEQESGPVASGFGVPCAPRPTGGTAETFFTAEELVFSEIAHRGVGRRNVSTCRGVRRLAGYVSRTCPRASR